MGRSFDAGGADANFRCNAFQYGAMIGIGICQDSADIPVGQGGNEGATFGGGIKNRIQDRWAGFPRAKRAIVAGAAGFFGKGVSKGLGQPLAEEGGVHGKVSGEMGYGTERRSMSAIDLMAESRIRAWLLKSPEERARSEPDPDPALPLELQLMQDVLGMDRLAEKSGSSTEAAVLQQKANELMLRLMILLETEGRPLVAQHFVAQRLQARQKVLHP